MMKIRHVLLVLLFALVTVSGAQQATESPTGDSRYVGSIAAPDFPLTLDWINTDAPISLSALEGKIILLDFWTYGCINCIHMMPVLEDLEERFAEELVVIGVHSAKFDNEGETENLEQIVQRYNIAHPVINDEDFLVWRSYQAQAWPTYVVIDPRGFVVAAQAGEVPYEAFEQYLSNMIEYYDNNPQFGTIDRTPLEFVLEGAGDPATTLAFPGKVLADTDGNRLFIADSNHNRIVITDLRTYEVLDIIGTSERGFADGDYDTAQFNQPQGMTLRDNTLYIADVNNHAIRAINLEAQEVSTIAGTGQMARTLVAFDTVIRDPLMFALRSPWDVELGDDDILYIAMAGSHQIWQLDLETNEMRAAVGSAIEGQISTTLAQSQLAQPSGLHWYDGSLYFADSESSTIRVADFNNDEVAVISGTIENDLFDYGDIDGEYGESRLQHALGVTANEDATRIYIADTYNSKIKVVDIETGITTTLFGLSGNGGYRDGNSTVAQFDEPGGLDYANGLLYVADTNNHAIRVIDLESDTVATIQFQNPEALVINQDEATVLGGNSAEGIQIELDEQTVAAGDVEIVVEFLLPDGYKINELTDSTIDVAANTNAFDIDDNRVVITDEVTTIPFSLREGETTITLTIALFYCEEDSFCLIDDVLITVPFNATNDAETNLVSITREVTLPEGLVSNE